MGDCESLLQRARHAPASIRFDEICRLAECHGFGRARQKSSHVLYKRAGFIGVMNFQNVGGMAKPYQVRQLLGVIDELGLTIEP
jgi:hypothetical protein